MVKGKNVTRYSWSSTWRTNHAGSYSSFKEFISKILLWNFKEGNDRTCVLESHDSCVEESELMGQERRQADKLGALVEWCTTVREMVVCTRRTAKKTVRQGQI